jgi:hypothetical protein
MGAFGSRLFAVAMALAWSLTLPISAAAQGGCSDGSGDGGSCFFSGPGSLPGICGDTLGSIGPSCLHADPDLWQGGGIPACGNVKGPDGWAIVRVRFDRKTSQRPPTEINVVRASSEEFAELARQLYVAAPVDNPQLFPPEVEMLLAAPRETCVTLWAQTPYPRPLLEGAGVEAPAILYFQAETDGKRIVSIDVLESEANERDLVRLLAYAKENLAVTIWSQDSPQVPLKVFGSLTVANGQVGFVVLAGSRLHQP